SLAADHRSCCCRDPRRETCCYARHGWHGWHGWHGRLLSLLSLKRGSRAGNTKARCRAGFDRSTRPSKKSRAFLRPGSINARASREYKPTTFPIANKTGRALFCVTAANHASLLSEYNAHVPARPATSNQLHDATEISLQKPWRRSPP